MSDTNRPRILHPRITKEHAAALLRSAKHSLEHCEPEYRDSANEVIENIARDLYIIFGPDSADVVQEAFGFAIVPGTQRHV